jgi:DNA-binding NarL/FixJ family response regulator
LIRAADAAARVILLTVFDADEDIYRGFNAGAKACLLKDAGRDEIPACIRRIHAGETFAPPLVAAKLAGRVGAAKLSEREIGVLMVTGSSNKEIAHDLSIAEATVKAHLKRIFAKLNVLSRTQAIAAAARRGLVRLKYGQQLATVLVSTMGLGGGVRCGLLRMTTFKSERTPRGGRSLLRA